MKEKRGLLYGNAPEETHTLCATGVKKAHCPSPAEVPQCTLPVNQQDDIRISGLTAVLLDVV